MKYIKIMKKISMVLALTFIGSSSLKALDIPTYYQIDIDTAKLTLESSKAILECLQSSCPAKEEEEIREKYRKEILYLYTKENTTPSKYLGFYTKNMKEIEEYYKNQITIQSTESVYDEIEDANSNISTLRKQQK